MSMSNIHERLVLVSVTSMAWPVTH